MIYDSYFTGMHIIWWIVFVILLIWIFATPNDISSQKKKKDSTLDILKKRFASGLIITEDYYERKRVLDTDTTLKVKVLNCLYKMEDII